jgi:hypothetical protein
MAGELGQWLQGQAVVREEARRISNNRYFYCAIALLPVLSFVWFAPLGDFRIFLTVTAFVGVSWWGYQPRHKAKQQTKHGINAAIAQALGVSYDHACEPGTGFDRARAHKLLPSYDRAAFEDLWQGEVDGHAFTLHEAHLRERRGSGKNRRWVTVFRGPIITIGFGRDFHGTTLVSRSGSHRRFLFFGEADSVEVEGHQLSRVDMVHPDFEDAFSVFSDDQVEARYLVHPAYIERLIALEKAFAGKDIRALFKDRELTVVLATENMFESGQLDASRDREMVEQCVSQFLAMAELAASLNQPAR